MYDSFSGMSGSSIVLSLLSPLLFPHCQHSTLNTQHPVGAAPSTVTLRPSLGCACRSGLQSTVTIFIF